MRVVLDTNIFVSALMSREGLPVWGIRLWLEKRYDLVTSEWQIAELRRVSRYERVKPYVSHAEVGTLVNTLREKALVLDNLPSVNYSSDIDDNPILATAIKGQVQYVVSGDKAHMLDLNTVRGIPIIPVYEFVRLFMDT